MSETPVTLTVARKEILPPKNGGACHPSLRPAANKDHGCLYCPVLPTVKGVTIGEDYKGGGRDPAKCAKTHRLGGLGPMEAKVLIVMERPSKAEDEHGEPLFDPRIKNAMQRAGIDWRSVRYTFAVRCRINRDKKTPDTAIKACNAYLKREIEKVDPDIIVVFGATAAKSVVGPTVSIMSAAGNPFYSKVCGRKRVIFPMHSPGMLAVEDTIAAEWQKSMNRLGRLIDGEVKVALGKGEYTRVTDPREVARMFDAIRSGEVAIDFETTGLEPIDTKVPVYDVLSGRTGKLKSLKTDKVEKARISIVSWTTEPGKGYYAVLSHMDGGFDKKGRLLVKNALRSLMLRRRVKKLFWNAVFEVSWSIVHLGCEPRNFLDVMLWHYHWDENARHGLGEAAQQLTGMGNWSEAVDAYAPLVGYNYSRIPLSMVGPYAGADVDATVRIRLKLRKKLDAGRERIARVVCPKLCTVIARMQTYGARGDGTAAALFEEYTRHERAIRYERIRQLPQIRKYVRRCIRKDPRRGKADAWEFNLNSTDQIRDILFGKRYYRLKPFALTKSNQPKCDKESLNHFKDPKGGNCDFASLLLEWRKFDKQHGTYAVSIQDQMSRFIGYIHGHFRIAGTKTGRLSSSEPNLQNIPLVARRMYKTRFGKKGCILQADYSQIEVRVAAMLSRDPLLLKVYRDGQDVHFATMCRIFNMSPEDGAALEKSDPSKYKKLRTIAKRIVFGVIYGIGAQGVMRVLRSEGVHISEEEAQKYIDRFFKVYKQLRRWIDDQNVFLMEHGYVLSPFMRRRHLKNIWSSDFKKVNRAKRQGPNAVIQSAASDFTTTSMILIDRELQKRKLRSRIFINVHDSIVLDCPLTEVAEVAEIVKHIMENVPTLGAKIWGENTDWSFVRCPIVAELEVGHNWRDAVKYKPGDDLSLKMEEALKIQTAKDAEQAKTVEEVRNRAA